ncbi:MAG: type II toxin-antitoxin system RelE/ParE family toxin [Bryobacterales bacterium]|nr:type II toxin-antitoxin system RelE/ParE family toxin [Bryobacterales bacterium]MBV9396845.1 type II toxin-antitoxin system RelE/ParE family toxin [Bryobacterales bacterium]
MRRIRWTTDASDQLTSGIEYIRKDDPLAAQRTAQAVMDRTDRLSSFPALGRPGEVNGTRELVSLHM